MNPIFTKKFPGKIQNRNRLYRKIDLYGTKGVFKIQYLDDNEIVVFSYNHPERDDNFTLPTVWMDSYKLNSEGSPLVLEVIDMKEEDINPKYNFKFLEKEVDYSYHIGAYHYCYKITNGNANFQFEHLNSLDNHYKNDILKTENIIIDVYKLDKHYISDKRKEFFLSNTNNDYNYYLYYYYPLRMGYDEISEKIIQLKNNENEAIDYFYNILIKYFDVKFGINDKGISTTFAGEDLFIPTIICVVPGHEASKKNNSGIAKVARKLVQKYGFTDGVDSLIRTKTIPKKAIYGKQNINIDRDTIKVVNPNDFGDKRVIIFDDVTTTGNSLQNAYEKIREFYEYDFSILRVAIGKTVKNE